jgi:hypothetical protein
MLSHDSHDVQAALCSAASFDYKLRCGLIYFDDDMSFWVKPMSRSWFSDFLMSLYDDHSRWIVCNFFGHAHMALHILHTSKEQFTNCTLNPADGIPITEKITYSFIQNFMLKNYIVYHMQSGRLSWSPEKERHMKMLTTFHLGVIQCGFLSREYNKNYIENVDETHFVINIENRRTLGFRGDETVKYVDVVSGGEAMTMVVCITRGVRAAIMIPMIIFTNQMRNYPIHGVQDNVPRVCYWTRPKGWMDMNYFRNFLMSHRLTKGICTNISSMCDVIIRHPTIYHQIWTRF